MVFELVGGERGIRTPGPVTVNGFQYRRIRPLCHLSAAKVRFEKQQPKKKYKKCETLYFIDFEWVILANLGVFLPQKGRRGLH